ncbi:uncharacterized protein [Phaseolus vulgaris]|uniref:uncharacterized protein n=1 Tax=Phaseolus vulgaris TaxID=3885 RepID=UPI0035CC96A2
MQVGLLRSGSLKEKKLIWDEINACRASQLNKIWCVVGDFNSIRTKDERKSLVSSSNYSREIHGFNEFIEKAELLDIPMVGRKFTWYKPNGTVKSRIDRVLVSKKWMEVWPNSKQFIYSRSVPNHFVLVIKDSCPNWGTKPFCSLDIWQKDNRFKDFVRCKWLSYEVHGRGLFVFKEKLKKLKVDLKVWNKEVFGDVNQAWEILKNKIQELDVRDDVGDLDEECRLERRSLLAEQNENAFRQEAVIHQIVRLKWLKHSDLNSKKFHSAVKWRRVRNGINGLFVDGRWCEDKEVVKDKIRDFFKARFEGVVGLQVRLDNVSFNSIFVVDNKMLVSPFSEEEVKDGVWSYDSLKSPGLDGFNFELIKLCWEFFRDDILLAVNDFASFGK